MQLKKYICIKLYLAHSGSNADKKNLRILKSNPTYPKQ